MNVENFTERNKHNRLITGRSRSIGNEKLMVNVQTVFKDAVPTEDIDLFLDSFCFLNCLRFFVLLYILGLALTDYSFRLEGRNSRL